MRQIEFRSDNAAPAADYVLTAIGEANTGSALAYGNDDLTAAKTGDTVGTISCTYEGRALFSGNLVADTDAVATPAPTATPAPATPEPVQDESVGDLLAHANPGVYIFGALSVLLAASLITLIVLYLKKRR